MSRSPLFGVLFSLQNAPINSELTPQLVFEPLNMAQTTSQFDLQFSVLEGAASLAIGITYNTDLYERATISRLFGHYQRLLESVLTSPSQSISRLDMLSGAEREQLLLDFNQTARDYDLSRTVLDLFAGQAKAGSTSVALVFEGQTMSYGELDAASNRLGHYLRGLGVGPESLVGICLERGMDMVVAILGILKSGGAYVPLDPDYPMDRISYMLTDSAVSWVVSSQGLSDRLTGLCQVIQVDGLERELIGACSSEAVISGVSSSNLAYVIYTSGSTGRPKGVMIEHSSLTNFLFAMNQQVPQTPNDHLLAITSISFDISILELLWPLTKGMGLTIKAKEIGLVDFDQYLDTSVKMDFSLFFFSSEADSAQRNKYQFLLNAAAFADQNDFSAIWLPERHFHKFGGIFPNPSVLAAAVASKTNKVELRAGSVVLPLHDPIRVAEEWSVVDNLSDGRVSLSIASGWHADDFVLSPESFVDRHSIMYSHIDQLQKLWKGASVTRKNGLGIDIDVKIFPQPVSNELSLWITSAGNEETFRSAGRLGAGILTHILGQNINTLERNIALYHQTLQEFGHAADKGKVALMLHTFVGESSEKVKEIVREPFKRYLASSINLLQNLQRSLRSEQTQSEELTSEQLLEVAMEKSMESGALFGDAEHCSRLIQRFYRIGVTEIACLIDFGVESELALKGLDDLNRLRAKFARQSDRLEMKEHPISTLQITPSYLSALIEDKGSSQFLRKLDTVLIGGEKLSEELVDRFFQKSKASVYNVYGPTETTIWSTVKKITADGSSVTIGKPIGNTQILILDKANNLCPIGVPGEMYIAGAGVARGYLDQPDKTAERFFSTLNDLEFEGRCYRTGDIVKWLPNGEIQYLGRNDNQIKLRGYRIEPGEIEQAIDEYEGVRQSLVVGTADGLLVAYLVVEAEFKKERLERYLRGKLPEFMVPSVLVEIQEFALTPNGKIDRSLLPVPGEFLNTSQMHVAPQTSTEVKLCAVIKELVKVDRVGLNDNFFAIGGHSLLAVRLIAFIRKEFQIELPIKALFVHRTIGDLCSHL
ncbi:MupA/Atu3671 family FMN-dependent luciferase-like monooxygenase, partial [Dyadobacter sp. OTU695]|uniref:MupA/Atu3671 family FMN-dependent luciferase-like monooxygenase n=1 Tax=Dyadobacter sp. OTU695 TaxID=3043860 RepID=UPI00313D662B